MTTSITPAVLQRGIQLTATAAVYITGGPNSLTIIKRAVFTNITGAAVTYSVWRVFASGTQGATNQIIPPRTIAAGSTDLAPELAGMMLGAGDTIQCLASAAASVNMFASGYVTS